MSGIQDEDLKKLIIGLWTTPQQREIDLRSDSETFRKLASEQENLRKFESKIDEILCTIYEGDVTHFWLDSIKHDTSYAPFYPTWMLSAYTLALISKNLGVDNIIDINQ